LDADKEGYLRSRTSLIQTAGRAARHINGEVVLFADSVTASIQALIDVSEYRRARQTAYNEEHGITPRSVRRPPQESLHVFLGGNRPSLVLNETPGDIGEMLFELEADMVRAASNLEYERAALLRDQIAEIKTGMETGKPPGPHRAPEGRGGRRRKRG
jgi:excinuclease ABC subunit B